MKLDDLTKVPKVFCESISIGYTPEYFIMALRSGGDATTFALTPKHMKRLLQYVDHQLTDYESKHGVIDAMWNPNIPSPLQPTQPPNPLS